MNNSPGFLLFAIFAFFLFLILIKGLFQSIRLVPAQTEFVVERLGKYHETLRAGFHILIPYFDTVAYTQTLKERTIDVPPQNCFTKDEIQVEIDGVIYLQIFDSAKACYGITDYQFAAIQLAQTTTRAIVGTLDLDKTFEEREAISSKVVSVLEQAASKWGVRILRFEIKNLIPPGSVRQAMEKQVTAERERRAILQKSIGEKEALINKSEGLMKEMINRSEGEMQRRINQAQGLAQEILSIGEATAESIQKISFAISKEGGEKAIRLDLSQKYFKIFSTLKDREGRVILPGDLTNIDALLKNMGLDV